MSDWYNVNHWYQLARNAVQAAVIEGRLSPDSASVIRTELSDLLNAAKTEAEQVIACQTFRSTIDRYREEKVHDG